MGTTPYRTPAQVEPEPVTCVFIDCKVTNVGPGHSIGCPARELFLDRHPGLFVLLVTLAQLVPPILVVVILELCYHGHVP